MSDSNEQLEATVTAPVSARQATLISGANTQEIDLPEESITAASVIERYAEVMNIPDSPRRVLINGRQVSDLTVVQPGDTVEVVREAGRKG